MQDKFKKIIFFFASNILLSCLLLFFLSLMIGFFIFYLVFGVEKRELVASPPLFNKVMYQNIVEIIEREERIREEITSKNYPVFFRIEVDEEDILQ